MYSKRLSGIAAIISLLLAVGCDERQETKSADENPAAESPAMPTTPTVAAASTPEENYQQYCALCHGKDREGYANDAAPSLRTDTLFGVGPVVPYSAIAYGRPGTPMGPYLDELGGPMNSAQVHELAAWLSVQAGVEPRRPAIVDLEPVEGDAEHGAEIYAENCASCHGAQGEGTRGENPGTALGNQAMLAATPDAFLRLTIAKGREGTPMPAFEDRLNADEINAVTAFLRTRAGGWQRPASVRPTPPPLDEYVLNPEGEAPEFNLKDGLYVMSEDLDEALRNQRRLVLLDTRVPYFWAMAHLPGSVPVPYYSNFDAVIENLPTDGTWVVAYCECPRAAAEHTISALRERGFANTAVLWEGYLGWTALGYPISSGEIPRLEAADEGN